MSASETAAPTLAANGSPAALAARLLPLATARHPHFLSDLAELVAIDSGSYSPQGVNRVADWVLTRLTKLGFAAERVPVATAEHEVGDAVVARRCGSRPATAGGRRVLLIAHMDTVFEDGTAAARPFALDGTLAYGPGVSDDKGGLLAGLTALQVLVEAGAEDYAELVFLAVPDEEIGSPASRPLTELVATGADYALVLECARENGDVVLERKGVCDVIITVTGRAAHSGIEPERGANAALAAAHLIVALQALNGTDPGTTVNVGVVRAGTRSNIVCPEAELRVEVRSTTTAGLRRATEAIAALASHPAVEGTTAHVEQLDLCPPMEDTPASRAVYGIAREAAAELGLDLGAASTGGVGDANLLAGTGVPTLDGLGPVGGADHSLEEWLDTDSVPGRVAVLAALTACLGAGLAADAAT
ncbi:M20 family metallopeptidase [Streptomyces sp. NPDC001070]